MAHGLSAVASYWTRLYPTSTSAVAPHNNALVEVADYDEDKSNDGACGLERTALSLHFPAKREFNRETLKFGLSFAQHYMEPQNALIET